MRISIDGRFISQLVITDQGQEIEGAHAIGIPDQRLMINSLILRQHCAPTATLIAHLSTLHTVVSFVWRGYVKV